MINGDKINEVLNRGVEEVIDRQNLEKCLKKGDKLRIKLGIDPTSSNIHIGRAVVLWKLRAFQDLGHQVIFIVGDFTGLIGDTSDKDSERPMLTKEEIKSNMATYLDQAYKILDSKKTEVHYNSAWLSKLGFEEIGKMADLFGLHEFESREVISRRLKTGRRVSLRELLYPLMQGYDSVAIKADIELGGTDQRFNLLAGRTIQPLYGQKSQDILMTGILEGIDGRKMSSSWGNVINIIDEPNDMFGKVMSINDNLIEKYFKLATNIPLEEIQDIIKGSDNPKNIKMRLAFEIVSLYHGSKEAHKASDEFNKVFSEKKDPEEIKEVDNKGTILASSLAAGIVKSNSEFKRLVEQKAVKLNNKEVKGWEEITKSGDIVKIGPRKFIKIK